MLQNLSLKHWREIYFPLMFLAENTIVFEEIVTFYKAEPNVVFKVIKYKSF